MLSAKSLFISAWFWLTGNLYKLSFSMIGIKSRFTILSLDINLSRNKYLTVLNINKQVNGHVLEQLILVYILAL